MTFSFYHQEVSYEAAFYAGTVVGAHISEVLRQVAVAREEGWYGPCRLVCSPLLRALMEKDCAPLGMTTVRERILKIDGIREIVYDDRISYEPLMNVEAF